MKIRFYSPKSCLNPSVAYYIPFLFPFWGKKERANISAFDAGRFDGWVESGNSYFQLVDSIEECDIVVLPYEWRKDYIMAFDLAKVANEFHKPFILFFNSDSTEEIPIDNAIIFRTSAFKSKIKNNEYGLPAWYSDLGKNYLNGNFKPKNKNDVPVIGYAGYIDYRNYWEYFKYISRYVRHPSLDQTAVRLRGICVRNMSRSHLVRTNFYLRSGCHTGTANLNERKEFVQCILDSDYSLVCRGGGNFSYRLYEILSLGKIPVFIDTDCLLPYDQMIDWKSFCLWVDKKDISKIDMIVSEYHSRISNQEFIRMQIRARQVYDDWLSPTGFYRNIRQCIPGLECHTNNHGNIISI
ncbi:MAG TPA: exostosin family protein [Hanamia sp.]